MLIGSISSTEYPTQDLENGINKKGISEFNRIFANKGGFAKVGSLAYSSIFPTTSVMINWHNQV